MKGAVETQRQSWRPAQRRARPSGRESWRLAFTLAAAAIALWLGFRDEVLGAVLVAWRIEVAQAVLALIHLAGMEAVREATAIYHPGGFAYEISRGCTGFVPAALLATGIAAHPAAVRDRLMGVGVGVPLILALNLARLVHLFYLGAHQPRWFHFAHTVAWEGIIILAVIGLWLAWAAWADGPRTRSGSAEPQDGEHGGGHEDKHPPEEATFHHGKMGLQLRS